MKKVFILIPIIAFGLFLFLARRSKYNDFHEANINGPIDTICRYRDYVMVYVKNVEYRIIPVSLNNAPQLDRIAKKGDSLFKKANSDALTLLHESDEAYDYTVKKW